MAEKSENTAKGQGVKWLRYFRLIVATSSENKQALDLSSFRCKFKISQAFYGKPCTAEITVYNVSKQTVDAIQLPKNTYANTDQYLKVIIEAGYESTHGVIFQGDLWWKTTGRESETDTYMTLVASTFDHAHQYAVVNLSIPKGATQEDVFSKISQSMGEKGVKQIAKPDETLGGKLPRGKVMYAMAEKAMQAVCDTNGFYWGYGNDGLIAVPKEPIYQKDKEAIVLTPLTGLLGRPKITVDGISLSCLIDPRIDFGSYIKIENARLTRETANDPWEQDLYKRGAQQDYYTDINGFYQVMSREIEGDTRDTVWQMNLICRGGSAKQEASTSSRVWTNYQNI